MAREFAPGLPDPRRFGHTSSLPTNVPLAYVIQQHLANRAGKHYDIRFGPDQGHKPTLLSWASRKLPAAPGQKVMAFQQPLHTGAYAGFQGKIVKGYGAGTVTTHDRGAVMVTKAEPDKINFVVLHRKYPETFTLVRQSGPPKDPKTPRERQTQGGSWLMINTTPAEVIKHKKVHYAVVPAAEVDKLFDPQYLHEAKVDGAAALYKLLSDRIEVLSYRPNAAGRPIVHTYRVGGTTGVDIPKHLVGSILRGELYGVRTSTGRAIPAQELGGLLNASTLNSLEMQKQKKVELRNLLFNIQQYGGKPVSPDAPYEDRLKMLEEIAGYLPKTKFGLPEVARTPEEQRALWERVRAGQDPLTHEGIVAWPKAGGKPSKVKLYSEHDVYVRDIFPGEGKLKGTGAGGFKYSLTPEGPVVGEVGTGFTEATRKQMFETPDDFKGRIARIKAQEQFPSGAYRAPAYLALHEDYPAAKAAAAIPDPRLAEMYAANVTPTTMGQLAGQTVASPVFAGINAVGAARGAPGTTFAGRFLRGYSPSAMAKYFGGLGLAISGGLEGAGALSDAAKDPRYQAGEIGYLRALGGEVGRMGDVAQAKTHEAIKKNPVTGLGLSALQGLTSPIGTLTGLGKATWNLLASPFRSKQSNILAPVIKQAVAALGGEGSTMADLVSAAQVPPAPKPGFGDRVRGLVLGMKPEELVKLRAGAGELSKLYDLYRNFRTFLAERPAAATLPRVAER